MSSREKTGPVEFKIHPIAAMYPGCTPEEKEAMKISIRQNGLIHAATLWEDDNGRTFLIDGLNRARIVAELLQEGIEVADNGSVIEMRYVTFEGRKLSEVIQFIESNNMARRTLSASQRAAIGVRAYQKYIKALADENNVAASEVNTGEQGEVGMRIAARTSTNRQYVYQCIRINESKFGTDLMDQIIAGKLKINNALKVLGRREQGLPDEEEAKDPTDTPVQAQPTKTYDGLKNEVHPDHKAIFAVREKIAEILKLVKKVQAETTAICEKAGGRNINLDALNTDLKNITANLRTHQPHSPCPNCAGAGKTVDKKKCPTCTGSCFLDMAQWKLLTPEVRAPYEKKASAPPEGE